MPTLFAPEGKSVDDPLQHPARHADHGPDLPQRRADLPARHVVPILIGAPLIGGIARWKSGRLLLAGGGELDQAYESVDRATAPLGLPVAERPTVTIEPKGAAPFRMGGGDPASDWLLDLWLAERLAEAALVKPAGG